MTSFNSLLVVSLLCVVLSTVSGKDVVLKPSNTHNPASALILLPHPDVDPSQYSSLATSIQSQASSSSSSSSVWVGIGQGSAGAAVPRLLAALQSSGLPSSPSTPTYLAAHGPAAAGAALDFSGAGNVSISAVVLLGGFIPRSVRGPVGSSFAIPVLTLAGELDGVSRITRNGAEAFYTQTTSSPPSPAFTSKYGVSSSDASSFPVVVVPGASHMSFTSGSAPPSIRSRDLAPTTSEADAHSFIAKAVSAFLFQSDSSFLASALDDTTTILQPLIDAMIASGNHRLHAPCNSDFPTNPSCQYPSWPAKSLPPGPAGPPSPLPPSDCSCGSSFVSDVAVSLMAGFDKSSLPAATVTVKDCFQDPSDTHPFHLPHIFNSCSDKTPCVMNTSTVSFPIYEDTEDDGVAPLSALELRTKLKSRQALWEAAGLTVKNENATDGDLHHCAVINNASWAWALQHASPSAKSRFFQVGENLQMDVDFEAPIGITGPEWIKTEMRYKRVPGSPPISGGAAQTALQVQSITFVVDNINHGDTPWWIPAGMHYCKILSPARAMEHLMVDGLRQYGSLANTSATTSTTTSTFDDDIILKPSSSSGKAVGLIWAQGAEIANSQYVDLFTLVQNVFPGRLYIIIPAFPGKVVEPVVIGSTMSRALKELTSAGLPAGSPVFVGGHSLGGAMIPDWTNDHGVENGVVGQILMGAFLTRKYTKYPVPTLAIGGELDGLARCTRFAEEFYRRILHPVSPSSSGVKAFPVVVLPGVTHMQFASGTPPSLVKDRDLKPEVTYEQAHDAISKVTVAFMKLITGDASGLPFLQSQTAATEQFVAPLLDAMALEGSSLLKPVCYKESPGCIGGCPYTPSPSCAVNNSWVATAQAIVGGAASSSSFSSEFTYDVHDEYRPVSQTVPLYSPSIHNSCSSPDGCVLNTSTYSDLVFPALSGLDTGFYPISANEIRAKLVSRQWSQKAAGMGTNPFNQTDGNDLNLCAAANKQAYAWAQAHAAPATVSRFAKLGQPYTFGNDIPCSTGPGWLAESIKFDNSSADAVIVSSPSLPTSLDYPVSGLRGFHFCSLLSPYRAMEWMYVDGLRLHDGLTSP